LIFFCFVGVLVFALPFCFFFFFFIYIANRGSIKRDIVAIIVVSFGDGADCVSTLLSKFIDNSTLNKIFI